MTRVGMAAGLAMGLGAFVLLSTSAASQELHKLVPSDGTSGDSFGRSVSLDGGRALVGAYRDDDNGSNSGSAYVFDASTGQIFDAISGRELQKLTPSDGAAGDYFGASVSLDRGLALVGAYLDDDNGGSSGSAYLFELSAPGIAYCAGDGISPHTPCPFGNDNDGSLGGCFWGDAAFPAGGVLAAHGSHSVAADDAYLVAHDVPNDFGLFFGAANRVNGGNGNPLNDGLRCAGGSLHRLHAPTAVTNHALTLGPLQTLDPDANAGSTRRYQFWFRSPGGPGGTMANLTNGYEIVWAP